MIWEYLLKYLEDNYKTMPINLLTMPSNNKNPKIIIYGYVMTIYDIKPQNNYKNMPKSYQHEIMTMPTWKSKNNF